MTHLFDDDSIIFGKATERGDQVIKDIFEK